ncbi:MAG: ParB N-terminal domain-containing protein [Planctomycetales bacterium]|nr:ParB N-terminal domain-containing protein [Planctomycetales bacterium]
MHAAVFRDRIVELVRVPASELIPHPHNWRTHPEPQREALEGILQEIGFADALLARRRADGRLALIDGHLRAETLGRRVVPVLVVDLTEEEADKLLAAFDPLTEMAGVDGHRLKALLAQSSAQHPAVQSLFDGLAEKAHKAAAAAAPPAEVDIRRAFHVLVECDDERQQRDLFERLAAEGRRCRLMQL